MNNLVWYLIAGTKGGFSRGKIIAFLKENPANANKISEKLHMEYKTVRHHLKVLEKNNIIYAINKGKYGAVYFLTEYMNANLKDLGKIWDKFYK